MTDLVERIWYGASGVDRLARALLRPAEEVYAGVTALRNALYDRGMLASHASAVPALSLGNLSVGGTGKTPVAAWAARALQARGGTPAIVLRGYGDDEPQVHRRLNQDIVVVADANRVRGVREAARQGADCVVLDDAFQHRRIDRIADWVLVSAESWRDDGRRLPAGPLRESARALARASLVIVTRKSASLAVANTVAERLARHVPAAASAVVHLMPDALVAMDRTMRPLADLDGGRFLAVAAVGAPAAFFAQLRALGAEVDEAAFRDHHRFTVEDVIQLARRASGTDGVICTLKDAVKLGSLWRGADVPLWYVSQAVAVDRGGPLIDASLDAVLTARVHHHKNAGSSGPSFRGHGNRSSTPDR